MYSLKNLYSVLSCWQITHFNRMLSSKFIEFTKMTFSFTRSPFQKSVSPRFLSVLRRLLPIHVNNAYLDRFKLMRKLNVLYKSRGFEDYLTGRQELITFLMYLYQHLENRLRFYYRRFYRRKDGRKLYNLSCVDKES